MEYALIFLAVIQAMNLLAYRWVGMVYFSQPRFNHPAIFHNAAARSVLCYGPLIAMVILVLLAFALTDSPWWFLGLTVGAFISFSTRPHPDVM